jgi:hypothetical protein
MTRAASTIVVVPREAHSPTVATVRALLENTPAPLRLIVVHGGAPGRVDAELRQLATKHDFTLVVRDAVILANEARNIGMTHVDTEFTVFVDNDTLVTTGWLGALERCAQETDASLVCPAVLVGPPDKPEIHFVGGTCRIVGEGEGRRYEEQNGKEHRPAAELQRLTRVESEGIELHCALARTDALHRVGPFDEQLLVARDHTDLGLKVRQAGGSVWLEPLAVVRYQWPKKLRLTDYPFYLARWSDQLGERSYERFNSTWGLRDTRIDEVFRRGHRIRRWGGQPPRQPGLRGRVRLWRHRARRAVDMVVTPIAVGAVERRRAKAAPAAVVHCASWDRALDRRFDGSEK